MKKISILFRTSGGRTRKGELGFGHIYRCNNLANQLSKNNIYFLIEDNGGAKEVLLNNGFKNIIVKHFTSIDADIKETCRIINEKNIDIVIIDIYKVKTKYLKEIRKLIKTVVIADLKIKNLNADLLVNGFVGFENQITENRHGAKCLLGPKYQILNKKFAKKKIAHKKKYKLLATFGAFDDYNLKNIFLDCLKKYIEFIPTKIILGPSTIKSKKMQKLEKIYPNLKIIEESTNMWEDITSAEFGICSGGLTTYEFAASGVPFAIICQVKHQLITAKEWQRKNFAINLGLKNKKIQNRLEKYLEGIVGKDLKIKTDKQIIDGLGAQRVSDEIFRLKSCINT